MALPAAPFPPYTLPKLLPPVGHGVCVFCFSWLDWMRHACPTHQFILRWRASLSLVSCPLPFSFFLFSETKEKACMAAAIYPMIPFTIFMYMRHG